VCGLAAIGQAKRGEDQIERLLATPSLQNLFIGSSNALDRLAPSLMFLIYRNTHQGAEAVVRPLLDIKPQR
jgi:DNA-binding MltR family transcriptional regulator